MIGVRNLARTIARMAQVGAQMTAVSDPAVRRVAEDVASEARRMVAVETGATRDSITVTEVGVEASEAALYLEFGTYKMAAQPFMRPAADGADAEPAIPIFRAALRRF